MSNALALTGILRSDIRSSFGSMRTAAGVPTTLQLTLVRRASCADLSGDAIDVWHCNRDGEDSLYGVTDQNYLRGVQETDASGLVTFSTIFPACYSGRMPHIHMVNNALRDGKRADVGVQAHGATVHIVIDDSRTETPPAAMQQEA